MTRVLMIMLGSLVAAPGALRSQNGAMNPFVGRKLYVDTDSPAARQAAAWQRSRPQDAELMRHIASQPQAIWLGDWMRDVRREVDATVSRIVAARALPVLVAYNIPHRDCGSYSAGGATGGADYTRWMNDLAAGLKGRPSVVILEPDALAGNDCLPFLLKDERYVLLRTAVQALTQAGALVYIDAGHANWKTPEEMADRLRKAGIELAAGFSLNISNFQSNALTAAYGDRLSGLVGGKRYIIDTSRNGRPGVATTDWCNPREQALGAAPTADTKLPLVDAFLWIKAPGQSDGLCNGGPKAGEFWGDYALELSKMAAVLGNVIPR